MKTYKNFSRDDVDFASFALKIQNPTPKKLIPRFLNLFAHC